MNLFYNAEAVFLKSYHGNKYLHAKEDGESVSQDRSTTSNNNRWTVEIVTNNDGSPFLVRLKSCYNKYLTASDQPFLLGMTGCKVLQTALPHEMQDSSIEWEPIREANRVKLKEFLTEIQLLSRYKHPNFVSLLGFCQEDGENILI